MSSINSYIQKNFGRFTDELLDLLRIPSVSADSKHNEDTARCADAVMNALLKAGCTHAEICPTEGHPIVYGEKIIDPSLPTVLTYGHYDVQPADISDGWKNDPFDLITADNRLVGRGAVDNKGQIMIHIYTVLELIKTNNLKYNIRFMIE